MSVPMITDPPLHERPEEVNLCYQAACQGDIDGVKKQVQCLLHEPRWSTSERNKPYPTWLFESLFIAIEKQNLELVQFLLDEKVAEESDLPFEAAVRARAFGIMDLFLGLGWDINTPMGPGEPSTLSIPICQSDWDMVQWLLDHGADPNSRCDWDLTPMSQAVLAAPLILIDYLFSRGANPRCGQLLHWAVIRDKVDALQVVRRIVGLGVPINEIKYENDLEGWSARKWFGLGTPLHRAAEFGKVDIVKYLLEAGADPLKLDTKGKTPRYWAETCNFTEVALILKEAEERQLLASVPAEQFSKRLRAFVDSATTIPADSDTPFVNTEAPIDPVGYWVKVSAWPKEYFEPDTMSHLLARRKSTPSLRRKRSEPGSLVASSATPSDQRSREEKNARYRDARYETLLETKGSYMGRYVGESEEGITRECKEMCRTLLGMKQPVPEDSMFQDAFFQDTCEMLRNRNQAKVIQDISLLIVPSAQSLSIRGFNNVAKHLRRLIESVDEGWNNSVPLTGTRPQPDYSVGFKREAFSEARCERLAPFIGGDQSFFMATHYMYFPFLTCEVKCGAAALDIADRKNAHSMTLASRAVVELFRLVGREKEINREILAFSVSHDHRSVRMYGHYAVVDGPNTTFYRHPIHEFSFTALDGKEKWTAYRFTRSVYDTWMPTHFERLCSAIDDLPSGINFDVPPLQQDSGLSQELE